MGELHQVIQIKPYVVTNGAFIKVKSYKEFIKIYESFVKRDDSPFNLNTYIEYPQQYIEEKEDYGRDLRLNLETKTSYLYIRSGMKDGFANNFNDLLKEISAYIEDSFFFVIWDNLIYEYRIENETFSVNKSEDDRYNFINYFEKNFPNEKGNLCELILEDVLDLKGSYSYYVREYGEIGDWIIEEEFQEALDQIEKVKALGYNTPEINHLKGWLHNQLGNPKKAISILNKSIDSLKRYEKIYAEYLLDLSECYIKIQNHAEAKDQLNYILKTDFLTKRDLAYIYYLKAKVVTGNEREFFMKMAKELNPFNEYK
ncbi:MAG: tetratricopeptide repeat protein [Desulfobacterales bacterium]|nr:tetratricopeptide repeat protein [Desulfobacterales bacterium]MCP4161794.1 tetratricopeptide repeat protein [Deltaproteobacteria bacterium]